MNFKIEKRRLFSSEYDYAAFSVVRVHPKVLKQLGGRNSWIKISSESRSVFRIALGAKSSSGFTMKSIEIDYDSCLELGKDEEFQPKDEDNFYPCKLDICKASCSLESSQPWV